MSSAEVWLIRRVLNNSPAVWNRVTEIALLHKLHFSPNVICREDAELRILCPWPSVLSQSLERRGGRVWKATGAVYIQPPVSHIHQEAQHLLGISVQPSRQKRLTDASGSKHSLSLPSVPGRGVREHQRIGKMSPRHREYMLPNASPLGKEGAVGWKGSIKDYTHSLLLVWNRQYP